MENQFKDLKTKTDDDTDLTNRIDMLNNDAYDMRRINTKQAYGLAQEAYDLSKKYNYARGYTDSLVCIATLDSLNGKLVESIGKFNKALSMCEELQYIECKLKIFNSLGLTYSQLGRKEKSLEYYQLGLELAKASQLQDERLIFILNNIGELYRNSMNMYDEALSYYFEAIDYCKYLNSKYIWFIYNNIGDTYLQQGNLEKALEYSNTALQGASNTSDMLTEAVCHKTLGNIYTQLGDQEKTIENFYRGMILFKQIGNMPGELDTLIGIGNFFIQIKDYNSALDYMLQALEQTQKTHALTYVESIHRSLADIYENLEKYKESIHHYKNYINASKKSNSNDLEKKLKSLLVESKIKQTEQENEIYRLKNIELKTKSEELERKAQELEESYKNISIISEIGQKITSSLDIETIMLTIYNSINELMDASSFGIGIYDELNGNVDYKMFIENGRRLPRFISPLDVDNSLAAKCIVNKQEIVIDDDTNVFSPDSFIPDDSEDASDELPRSLIFYPLITGNHVIGTITVQSYKPNAYNTHHLNTIKALASYITIALINSQKSEELKKSAKDLQDAIHDLQEAQEYLINSEKMAALGQLISGIAHEINTPLGAIQASLDNINGYMEHTIVEKLPRIFDLLDTTEQNHFFKLLHASKAKDVMISTREERKLKRSLSTRLEELNIIEHDILAESLSDMGIFTIQPDFMPLLYHSQSCFILQTCYEMSGIMRNIRNMEIAVGKASKMLYSLKNYSHTTQTDTFVDADIIDGIETILDLYHNNIKQGTKLIKNYEPIPQIKCIPDELNQVWTNLIHNSLQAMDYKGVLEIFVRKEDNDIVVCITDTGKGIEPEIENRVFDPFFTTKRSGEGSGLGLGIAKKIVDKHNGIIGFVSRPGKTVFTVRLPIR